MSWRGSTTITDRIFACLPYLLPLLDGVIGFGANSGLIQLLHLEWLFTVLAPVMVVYRILGPYADLIVFFGLFLLVVRNEKISHFIRFNTMQALLLDIVVYVCGIILRIVGLPGLDFAIQVVASTIFIGILASVVYSVGQSLFGRYAEIPAISDAVYMQVR